MNDKHPALEIIDTLIKERELGKLCHGTYSYPYGHSMLYECHDCGATSEDDADIPHKEGCPQVEYNKLKGVNLLHVWRKFQQQVGLKPLMFSVHQFQKICNRRNRYADT